MQEFRTVIITIISAVAAFLEPISSNVFAMLYFLSLNFLVGVLVGIIVDHEPFEWRKAGRCAIEALIFFSLVASFYVVGKFQGNPQAAITAVSTVIYAGGWFYFVRILRNLLRALRPSTPLYNLVHFLYSTASLEIARRIPYLSTYLASHTSHSNHADTAPCPSSPTNQASGDQSAMPSSTLSSNNKTTPTSCLLIFFLLSSSISFLSSCRSASVVTEAVPMPSVHADTLRTLANHHTSSVIRDTLILRDTTWISTTTDTYQRGGTIYRDKLTTIRSDRYLRSSTTTTRDTLIIRDTLRITSDSISIPIQVPISSSQSSPFLHRLSNSLSVIGLFTVIILLILLLHYLRTLFRK